MVKHIKRKIKQQQTQRPQRRVQTRRPAEMGTHPDEATLIGLTDPFSGEAAQARYPDQGSGRSLTWQQRYSISISTNADGQSAMAFNPKADFPALRFDTIAGDTVNWMSTWEQEANSLLTEFGQLYRPTSMGVRFINLLSATESSGSIVIAKSGTRVGSTTFIPSNFSSWDEHPMQHGGEWHTTSHPRNSDSYDFKLVSDFNLNSNNGDPSWETVYMYISGSKSAAIVMKVELYINYEYIANEDASINQLAFPQPVLNVQMQAAINHIQSSHPSASHKGPKTVIKGFIKKEAKKAILKHILPFAAKKATQLLL